MQQLNVEVDFALWYRKGRLGLDAEVDEPVLMFGEAKSFGRTAFKQKDIDNLKVVGEKFPGAFLIVSALKPFTDFSDEEVELIKGLAEWGRQRQYDKQPRNPVILLTGDDLTSDNYLEAIWKAVSEKGAEILGPAYIRLDDPYMLAEMSQRIFLELPCILMKTRRLYGGNERIWRVCSGSRFSRGCREGLVKYDVTCGQLILNVNIDNKNK